VSSNTKRLEAEALNLPAKDRADLADKLWLSVESEQSVAEAWAQEIERRIRELRSGVVKPVSHEDVVAELRSRYGE
jgi:putative addiction module component (TIGR02574 family)